MEALLEGFSFDQFHDEEHNAILLADVVQSADVRVRQLGDSLGFTFQTLPQGWIGSKSCRQNFDRDIAP